MFVIVIVPEISSSQCGFFLEVPDSDLMRVLGPFSSPEEARAYAEEQSLELQSDGRGSGCVKEGTEMSGEHVSAVWAYLREVRKDDGVRWW